MSDLSKVSSALSTAESWFKSIESKDSGNVNANGFETALFNEMGKVFGQAKEVDASVAAYNSNSGDESIERVAFLMAKSEADMRLAVQVRNKAVAAYQEIMNLQI
jgi:flagellar hook-basal body complex protein FliE